MEGKPKVGRAYLFDSAPQEAFDAWRRPVTLKGIRTLIKAKDTLMDKLQWINCMDGLGIILLMIAFYFML